MNPQDQLMIESITTHKRPGLVIIIAPIVEEAGKSSQDGMYINTIGGMPFDAALGQLEILKARMIGDFFSKQGPNAKL